MDMSTQMLRVVQGVAEHGSITAAAKALGYSQPAVSRQLAAAERQAGTALFARSTAGARPTPAGVILLRHAAVVLREFDLAAAELSGAAGRPPLRLGVFPAAGALLLPVLVEALRYEDVTLTTREGSTASLIRAVRSGTIDAAIITQRPPFRAVDRETPALVVEPVLEERLRLAVAAGGPLGHRDRISVGEAAAQPWIAPPASLKDPHLGVWPGLPGRPRIAHRAADWLSRLALVAAGAGVTTVPGASFTTQVRGIRVIDIDGVPEEHRRVSLISSTQAPHHGVPVISRILRDNPGDL